MNSSRPIIEMMKDPQKGDEVQLGVIKLKVKKVFKKLDKKGEKVLDIRFQGENNIVKQLKSVTMSTWQDQLLYLIRIEGSDKYVK